MIESIRPKTGAGIREICRVLEVPRSSYHAAAKPTATQLGDQKLSEQVTTIFLGHRRRYGYRRIHDDLERLRLGLLRRLGSWTHEREGITRSTALELRAPDQRRKGEQALAEPTRSRRASQQNQPSLGR